MATTPMSAMPDAGAAPDDAAASDDESAPAESDLSKGYTIELSVLPDGTYQLSPPEPLEDEAEEEMGEAGSEVGETFPSIGEALKAMLRMIKTNPVGEDGQAQFGAGYEQG